MFVLNLLRLKFDLRKIYVLYSKLFVTQSIRFMPKTIKCMKNHIIITHSYMSLKLATCCFKAKNHHTYNIIIHFYTPQISVVPLPLFSLYVKFAVSVTLPTVWKYVRGNYTEILYGYVVANT